MAGSKPDFAMVSLKENEPETTLPAKLEIVNYGANRTAIPSLTGGAYDPYEHSSHTGDVARSRKPRTDLRKLSEWIKTTRAVVAQRGPGNTNVER